MGDTVCFLTIFANRMLVLLVSVSFDHHHHESMVVFLQQILFKHHLDSQTLSKNYANIIKELPFIPGIFFKEDSRLSWQTCRYIYAACLQTSVFLSSKLSWNLGGMTWVIIKTLNHTWDNGKTSNIAKRFFTVKLGSTQDWEKMTFLRLLSRNTFHSLQVLLLWVWVWEHCSDSYPWTSLCILKQ